MGKKLYSNGGPGDKAKSNKKETKKIKKSPYPTSEDFKKNMEIIKNMRKSVKKIGKTGERKVRL
jgi:hypothetical protein